MLGVIMAAGSAALAAKGAIDAVEGIVNLFEHITNEKELIVSEHKIGKDMYKVKTSTDYSIIKKGNILISKIVEANFSDWSKEDKNYLKPLIRRCCCDWAEMGSILSPIVSKGSSMYMCLPPKDIQRVHEVMCSLPQQQKQVLFAFGTALNKTRV